MPVIPCVYSIQCLCAVFSVSSVRFLSFFFFVPFDCCCCCSWAAAASKTKREAKIYAKCRFSGGQRRIDQKGTNSPATTYSMLDWMSLIELVAGHRGLYINRLILSMSKRVFFVYINAWWQADYGRYVGWHGFTRLVFEKKKRGILADAKLCGNGLSAILIFASSLKGSYEMVTISFGPSNMHLGTWKSPFQDNHWNLCRIIFIIQPEVPSIASHPYISFSLPQLNVLSNLSFISQTKSSQRW